MSKAEKDPKEPKYPIPAFQDDGKGDVKVASRKLMLSLRVMALEVELKDVPDNFVELHEKMLGCRQKINDKLYDAALIYTQMIRQDQRFFVRFGCRSLSEYLSRFGIAVGDRMGKLHILVTMFERDTFTLVGDVILLHMIRRLKGANSGQSERSLKTDIKAIFESYCLKFNGFSKDDFLKEVEIYVYMKYPPKAPSRSMQQPTTTMKVDSPKAVSKAEETGTPKSLAEGGRLKAKGGINNPTLVIDKIPSCSGCKNREEVIKAFEDYVNRLIKAIKHLKGVDLLERIEVPEVIRYYRDMKGRNS